MSLLCCVGKALVLLEISSFYASECLEGISIGRKHTGLQKRFSAKVNKFELAPVPEKRILCIC